MRKVFRCVVLFVLLFSFAVPGLEAGVLHGPIFNAANGRMYYLLTRNTWTGSEQEAAALSGHLATIRNLSEQNWVFSTFGQGFGGGRLLWIGGNDLAKEGALAWSSGEQNAFTFWAPGEPNNASVDEDYIALYYQGHDAAGRWNDWPNITADPIGIPFMGVVEIAPENFSTPLRHPVLVDFEAFAGMPATPQSASAAARLSIQLQADLGVTFSSGEASVAVVNLGLGHATSGRNGIGGIQDGSLDYSAPITITFAAPGFPSFPATTDFVSVRLDQLGGGSGVSMTAYGLDGSLLGKTNRADTGGRVLSLAIPGTHQVVIQGNGSAAFDDLVFNGLTIQPEITFRAQENSIAISWPAPFSDYVLQTTGDLNSPIVWTPVEAATEMRGNEWVVELAAAATQKFFRLDR